LTSIKSFSQLTAWKKAHEFALLLYKETSFFPEEEKFGLVSQLRRAVVSITSNIVEGFGRRGKKEKIQFYTTAKSSNLEIQSQLLISRDLKYLNKEQFDRLAKLSIEVGKLVGGLIKSSLNSKY
jgi:four helix bundle protein